MEPIIHWMDSSEYITSPSLLSITYFLSPKYHLDLDVVDYLYAFLCYFLSLFYSVVGFLWLLVSHFFSCFFTCHHFLSLCLSLALSLSLQGCIISNLIREWWWGKMVTCTLPIWHLMTVETTTPVMSSTWQHAQFWQRNPSLSPSCPVSSALDQQSSTFDSDNRNLKCVPLHL